MTYSREIWMNICDFKRSVYHSHFQREYKNTEYIKDYFKRHNSLIVPSRRSWIIRLIYSSHTITTQNNSFLRNNMRSFLLHLNDIRRNWCAFFPQQNSRIIIYNIWFVHIRKCHWNKICLKFINWFLRSIVNLSVHRVGRIISRLIIKSIGCIWIVCEPIYVFLYQAH